MSLPGPTGERFAAFCTDAEERWLTEGGPQPPRPRDRLPPRAPVLLPSPGRDPVSLPPDGERVRVLAGALVHRVAGRDRVLAPAGAVTRLLWLVDGAQTLARLPAAPLGHVVCLGADGPLVALRVGDWLAGELVGSGTSALRAAGFTAVAQALGVRLETNPADLREHPGGLAAGVRPLHPALPRRLGYRLAAAGLVLAVVLLLAVLLPTGHPTAAVAGEVAGLVTLAALDPLERLARRRRDRRPARTADRWWPAPSTTGSSRRRGPGIGLFTTPDGTEVVVADGAGWLCRMPGPDQGGVASVVVARGPDERVWGLLLADADEQVLLALPVGAAGADLAADLAATLADRLGTGPDGVVVSTAAVPPWPADRLHPAGGGERDAGSAGAASGAATGLLVVGSLLTASRPVLLAELAALATVLLMRIVGWALGRPAAGRASSADAGGRGS